MQKLSIVISAYNEEKNIRACLESAKWADEIVFINNSSTDNTLKIAKEFTKKVFTQKNNPEKIDLQKNFGISKASGDWILVLDAGSNLEWMCLQNILHCLTNYALKKIFIFIKAGK